MRIDLDEIKKTPEERGLKTPQEFIEDQHLRRRILKQYPAGMFKSVRPCANIDCNYLHDESGPFCCNDCRKASQKKK